ncbi:MAG: O-antigen ligase family protein [Opitutaceae bacterium]
MPSLIDKSGNIAYFGHLSWGNFFDWLVTLCLGSILALFTVSLGGARADTHVFLFPLFCVLLALHGIWFAVDHEKPKRLSHVPFLFLPFILWAVVNVFWLSPTPWLGQMELIYGLEAFILFWVFVNNVRTRAHLWVTIVLALSPAVYAIFVGFYQFFQGSQRMGQVWADHSVKLSPDFFAQASGSFGDPNSFAVFLLVLIPSLLITAAVPRLPVILRVLCFYVSLMFLCSLVFTALLWPLLGLGCIIFLVPQFCYKTLSKRVVRPLVVFGIMLACVVGLTLLVPKYQNKFAHAISPEGEAVRLELWSGAVDLFLQSPISGIGAGAYSMAFEQSPSITFSKLPQTPHNDYLLLLAQYGVVGFILFCVPIVWILRGSYKRLRLEPSRVKLKGRDGSIMPPQRFYLSVGLASFLVFLFCAGFSFTLYVPALLFYGVFYFGILVKSSTNRRFKIPHSVSMSSLYAVAGMAIGVSLYAYAIPRLQSHAIEMQARQRLEHLIAQGVPVSGNTALLERVVYLFEDAVRLDPSNADALVGLSEAHIQRFYQSPADFAEIGSIASDAAVRATEISSEYARAWGQLGVSYALAGSMGRAEQAFERALEIAPNNSNMHYYWAAFLSNQPERRADALVSVNRALEINPDNRAARRLQQKLLIL